MYIREPMYGLTDDELKINQLGTNSVRPNRADFKKTEEYQLLHHPYPK